LLLRARRRDRLHYSHSIAGNEHARRDDLHRPASARTNQTSAADAAFLASLRPEALGAPESGIVAVFNHGRNKPGLIPLWVGEGDLPTPQFICEAATESLRAGETFYTYQRGIPALREALSAYFARHYGRAGSEEFTPERFFVTGSGMMSLQIAIRMVAGAGDEVLLPTPAWPNFAAAIGVAGAATVSVPMDFQNGVFTFDIARLAAAIGPRDR
jgi:aspartate/methionine/tyrosine aminotransferase